MLHYGIRHESRVSSPQLRNLCTLMLHFCPTFTNRSTFLAAFKTIIEEFVPTLCCFLDDRRPRSCPTTK